jgi:NAD(P)-dependent dehydrogenase (short-subunit alcohol dehydrogenase family)
VKHGQNVERRSCCNRRRRDWSVRLPYFNYVLLSIPGIGQAAAIGFAAEGCTALALGDINISVLEETCSTIRKKYPEAIVEGYLLDVAEESSVEAFHNKTVAKFGRIDFAVNSAGYAHVGAPITQLATKEWDLSYSVNQKGVGLFTRQLCTCAKHYVADDA